MQNSVVMLTFFVCDWKFCFWENLVQNVKITSLTWNWVSRLIGIRRVQYDAHFFVFNLKYNFCANLVQNIKINSWSWNLAASLIRISKIQWCCSNSEFVLKQMYQECSMRVTKVADSPILCDKTENTSLFM